MTGSVRDRVPSVTKMAAVAVGALIAGSMVAASSQLIAVVTVAAGGSMALLALTNRLIRWDDDPDATKRIVRWTMASFVIHLAVGLVIVSSRSAIAYLGPDAFGYDAIAKAIVAHWSHGDPMPHLPLGKEGYYFLLATVYWVFRPTTWGGVALNAVMAGALVPIVSETTYRLFGSTAVRYVPATLLLVPGMVLWPSQLLKEAPFLLLLAVAANCAVRLVNRYSPMPVLVLVGVLPCLLWFRAQLSFAVMVGVLAGVVIGRREVVVGILGGLVTIGLVAGAIALGLGSSGYDTAVSSDLENANAVRHGSATSATSGFDAEADISSTTGALTFLPVGIVSVVLGPLPWQVRGIRQLTVVPDVLAWWVLVVTFWWGQHAARRRGRQWLALAAPAVAATAVIGLIVGNYGTIVRERMQILVLVAPIIALGLAEWQARRSQRPKAPIAV